MTERERSLLRELDELLQAPLPASVGHWDWPANDPRGLELERHLAERGKRIAAIRKALRDGP
jgi:hypothetical protein